MTKRINEQEIALAHRLGDVGIPIELEQCDWDSTQPACRGLLIDQVGGVRESRAFDLDCGGTGYVLALEIASNVSGLVVIRYFMLDLPWKDPQFCWLLDPADSRTEKDPYVFPDGLEYPRELVINHRTSVRGRLRRGDILDGLLLGVGFEPIPDCFQHGNMVDGTLCIVDQFGRRFSSEVRLWVDRSAKLLRRPRKRPRRQLIARVDHVTVEEPALVSR